MPRVFDGHCDTILRAYQDGRSFRRNGGHLDLERMRRYKNWAQFFACFGEPEDMPGKELWQVFQEEVAIFRRQMEENADLVIPCRTAEEAEKAWGQGKMAAFLSVEGAELLDCDMDKLEKAEAKIPKGKTASQKCPVRYQCRSSGQRTYRARRGLCHTDAAAGDAGGCISSIGSWFLGCG